MVPNATLSLVNCRFCVNWGFMTGSSHIQSVLIGVEYRNCRQTLMFFHFLLFGRGKFNQN